MNKISAVVMALLFVLLSANLYAAQTDAAGCKDHPLIPRMQDYYINACSSATANFDADVLDGKKTETVHIEGNSTAFSYSPQAGTKSKVGELQVRRDFENGVKKQGGKLLGETIGQKWPIYKIVKDGKEYWIVLLINSGKYFSGSYAVRIVEK